MQLKQLISLMPFVPPLLLAIALVNLALVATGVVASTTMATAIRLCENMLWLVAATMAAVWSFGVRNMVRSDSGVTQMTVNTAMLFVVVVVLVPATSVSPLYLLWMFPLAWLLGTLSLAFPFSLLSIPGIVFRGICCLGLGRRF